MTVVALNKDSARDHPSSFVALVTAVTAGCGQLIAASGSAVVQAHWRAIDRDIGRWVDDREVPATTAALRAPPGDPFGSDEEEPLPAGWRW